MKKLKATFVRNNITGFLSGQSVGTDALNAMRSIPGVENVIVLYEEGEQVTIEYDWSGNDCMHGEVLRKYGLDLI